jgi:hypothetical protein
MSLKTSTLRPEGLIRGLKFIGLTCPEGGVSSAMRYYFQAL